MWQRFFLSEVLVFTTLTLVLAAVQYTSLADRTRQEYGDRALTVSRAVANMPTSTVYFTNPESSIRIDPLLERMRTEVGADFLVVGGRLGMRYAHPFPPDLARRISRPSSSDDVLAGADPVEVGTQELRDFIWGKAAVRNARGEAIGLVSTGFLLPTVRAVVGRVMRGLLPWYGFGLLFALLSSLYLSGRLRRDLFELEPDQISALVSQHHAVLTALQDGVMVLKDGQVMLANSRALDYLGPGNAAGLPALPALWPELAILLHAEAAGLTFRERPVLWQRQPMLVSCTPLPDGQAMVLFRERAQAVALAEELTQVKQYAESLRAQTHEFTNRLHTITGLIQIGRAELALQIVGREADQTQQIIDSVSSIALPRLAALLAGKIARAREVGVLLQVDPTSSLEDHWEENVVDALVLALGNLVENAFDAVSGQARPTISVMVGEDSEGLQLEVRNTGAGLLPEHVARLEESGFTTKGPGRGQGLSLIRQHLRPVGGQIEYLQTPEETVFIVSIPAAPEDAL